MKPITKSNSNVRRHSGFTLVELLVVISIVSILLSMLLPAVNSARAAGKNVICQNNVRQLGMAMVNYCTDNKQMFPYNWCDYNTTGSPWDSQAMAWSATLQLVIPGYLPGAPRSNIPVLTPTGTFTTIPNTWYCGILRCPEVPLQVQSSNGYDNIKKTATVTFRNGLAQSVNLMASGDARQASQGLWQATIKWPGAVGGVGGLVYTNYGFNDGAGYFSILGNYPKLAAPCPAWLPFGVNGSPSFSYQQAPSQSKTEQAHIPRELWLASDGVESIFTGSATYGATFCHPRNAANFVYLDGHVENLVPGQLDAGIYQTSWDARLSLNNKQ